MIRDPTKRHAVDVLVEILHTAIVPLVTHLFEFYRHLRHLVEKKTLFATIFKILYLKKNNLGQKFSEKPVQQ